MTTVALAPMTKAEARQLTARIKRSSEALWALLVEAHDREAWKALGYRTFKAYVAGEFDMSERTGFRVLDQGKVSRALSEAAGGPVEVSQRQAAAIKPNLGEATERIESGEPVADVVDELTKSKIAGIDTPWTRSDEDALEAAFNNEGPAPREAGEGVADPPQVVTPSPATPEAPSGGEGRAPRARRAALSAGSSPAANGPETHVRALLALTPAEWLSVDPKLAAELATACRRRVSAGDAKPAPAMKAAKKPAPKAKDCLHPVTRRLGNICGVCGEPWKSK